MDTASLFLEFSKNKLLQRYWPRMRSCVETLSDEQVWWRPNESSNSIGNLLLHLNGNVRQWLVVPFNGLTDERDRPAEFAERRPIPRQELVVQLDATLREASAVLDRLTEADLVASREIQGYATTGLGAVYQVVEHFSFHYGQVTYVTKLLQDRDLGFYKELNANGRPERATTY